MIRKRIANILEKIFQGLDKMLHEVTYQELDNICVSQSNKIDKLEEEKEYLEDALSMVSRNRKACYSDY